MTSDTFVITPATFPTFNRADQLLRGNLEELARMTKEYPVECTFAGIRFVFNSRQDIENLIALLAQKMAAYRQSASVTKRTAAH